MLEKILLGMSGGVDSSVCAVLLKNRGYTVGGVTLKLFDGFCEDSVSDAHKVCEKLGLSHFCAELKDEFKNYVIDNFISEYINGRTPNPCIVCNKHIKFGKMLEIARQNGFEKIATGHYAKIEKAENGRYLLYKADDKTKDQTYVLYCLTQEQLSAAEFPLGTLSKAEARKIAEENGLINAKKKDSQDICFVPDGDYASFIERTAGYISQKGDYLDINGQKIGEHKGVIHYTVGQRKGLSVAFGKPMFVISKNAPDNTVVLGDEQGLFYKKVLVSDTNFIPFDNLNGKMQVTAKLRYSQKEQEAVIYPTENGGVIIEFANPQRAPSPGQAAVFYDGDMVVGGGIIVGGIE